MLVYLRLEYITRGSGKVEKDIIAIIYGKCLLLATVSTNSTVFVTTLPIYPASFQTLFYHIDNNKTKFLESIKCCRTTSIGARQGC